MELESEISATSTDARVRMSRITLSIGLVREINGEVSNGKKIICFSSRHGLQRHASGHDLDSAILSLSKVIYAKVGIQGCV